MNRRASIFIAVGMMLLAVAHGPAEAAGGYSVRSSKHFRVIYKSSEASAAYARFILDNSERAWKQIFGPLGYQQPKWLADRVKAGGLLQLRISKIKHLGMAMWESSVIGGKVVVTGGGLMIDLESRFKKAGKTQWELLRATCAHELFHIVQYGYDHKESKWLKETTATWIEDKVFPAEAKKAPKLYGFRFYLGRWNKHRRHYPLFTTGGSHEYAAAIFHQYLSEHDSRGNAVVRELWQEAAKVRGDTMLTALAAVVKDATKLGPNTQRRVTDLALADLIRSSKRSRKYSLATFLKGPFISPPLRKAAGLAIPGEKNGLLGSIGRTVATYAFDHVRLYADALKVGREVDVVVAVRGSADGAWAFQLVRAPRGDQWKVLDFPKPAGTNWTTLRVGAVDFTEEKLYVVATRLSITSSDKYRLSAMVLTPPIVKSFKVDAPSDEAGTGREEVWSIQRTALPRPEGTIWQTALVKKTGIAYRPEEQARFTVEFSRKMRGPLKLLLGSDVSVTLTAADKFSEKFTGSVAIRTLEKFLADGHIPVEVRGSDVFNMGLDGNVETSPRLVFKGSAAPKIASIERWEGNEPGAKRPGGVDNLSGRTIPLYKPEKPRPRLVGVKLWRRDSREVFYHDPGGAFRPVTPGLVEVRLYFRGAMDTTAKAEVAFSGNAIEGKWSGAKTWVGTFEVSAQAAGFAKVKGAHALSVQAKAAYGTMFDGDPEKPGDQP
ncbi:MAG: hypothetical protein QGD94_08575, partial [Planctomycetia bacterium]|nr:hypothetical protein [Planctomycetia bacterium]